MAPSHHSRLIPQQIIERLLSSAAKQLAGPPDVLLALRLQTELQPDVGLTQTSNVTAGNILIGDAMTITLKLTNQGNYTAINATVMQTLPLGLVYTGDTPTGKTQGRLMHQDSADMWFIECLVPRVQRPHTQGTKTLHLGVSLGIWLVTCLY